jgi:hypothetical protein
MTMLHDILRDVRYAWRQLRRKPTFAAVAVLTLGLGIAAQTTFFTIVNALIFKPTPAARLDGVNVIQFRGAGAYGRAAVIAPSLSSFARLEADPPPSVVAVGGSVRAGEVMVQVSGRAERLVVEGISPGYARVLDLPAGVGRWLTADDRGEASERVAVVSDALWRDWLGGRHEAVGASSIRINGAHFRVVGVAPPRYRGLSGVYQGVDVWVPISHLIRVDETRRRFAELSVLSWPLAGRATETIAGELNSRLEPAHRTRDRDDRLCRTEPDACASVGSVATALLGVGTLILLAACANVANLPRARHGAAVRGPRLSLGATRPIQRRSLTEAFVLAMLPAAGLVGARRHTCSRGLPTPSQTHKLTLDLSPDYRPALGLRRG